MIQNEPLLLNILPRLTDWQLAAFFAEEKSTGIIESYDDLFHWAWSQKGYTDTQIEQIWKWKQELKDDGKVWQRIVEAGFAREG